MNMVILVIIKNLFVNLFLVIVKILCGVIFNSTSLVADGIHSLSDLITDFISLFGEEIAKTKKGKWRVIFEDETSILIGIVIIALAIFMIIQSFDAPKTIPSALVIYVSIFAILVKIVIVRYVKKMGKKLNNSILISSAKESGADIITSIIAFSAILLSQLSKYIDMFKYSDIVGGLIIGVITLFVGFNIAIKNEKDIKRILKN